MKRVVTAACALFALGAAGPAWAQANGAGNPCLMDINLHANGLVFGAGSDLPVKDNDCWALQRAQFSGLMAVNSHNPDEQKVWEHAARNSMCSIPSFRDANSGPGELCAAAVPPVAAIPQQTPQVALQSDRDRSTKVTVPRPVMPAGPAIVASLSVATDPSPPSGLINRGPGQWPTFSPSIGQTPWGNK